MKNKIKKHKNENGAHLLILRHSLLFAENKLLIDWKGFGQN